MLSHGGRITGVYAAAQHEQRRPSLDLDAPAWSNMHRYLECLAVHELCKHVVSAAAAASFQSLLVYLANRRTSEVKVLQPRVYVPCTASQASTHSIAVTGSHWWEPALQEGIHKPALVQHKNARS